MQTSSRIKSGFRRLIKIAGPSSLMSTLSFTLGMTIIGFAEDSSFHSQITLDTITVVIGDNNSYSASSSSVASRLPMAVKEIPLSVSTITRQHLEDELIYDDMEAISRMSGMYVEGAPYASGISSRGFATLSNVDGLRMQSEDSNFTPVLDAFLLDSIEIMRGPAGLLEGAGQPGGVVNRQLKRPNSSFSTSGSIAYGSNQFKRTELEMGGPLNKDGSVRARIAGAFTDRGFFYDVADHQRLALLGTIEADLTDSTTVRLSAVHQKDKRTPFWGVPSHEDGYLLKLDRSTFLGSTYGRFDTDYSMYSGDLTHQFDNGWTGKIMANYFDQKIDEFDLMTVGPAYTTDGKTYVDLGLNVNQDRERGYNIDTSLSGDFNLQDKEHKFVVGASIIHSNLKVDERWGYDSFPVEISNPKHNLPLPDQADGGIRQDRDYRQFGIYGQLNYKITSQLAAIAGGRINWAQMSSDITGTVVQDYRESAFFTPLLGLVYDVNPSTSLYASYSDIYEPQFQRDKDRHALPPLTGTQYEAGVKTELFDSGLNASAAVFHITRKNQAHIVGRWAEQIYEADGQTQSKGVELEISGELNHAWKLFTGYTFMLNEVTDSKDVNRIGKVASNLPRHKFNIWLNHQFQIERLKDLQIGSGLTAVSRFQDYDNGLKAEGYVTLDAALHYKINPNLDLAIKASNILDKKYYERLGNSGMYHYYGSPRNITLQLKARL